MARLKINKIQTQKETQIDENINKLDVVFVVDVTGSMGPFIEEAKQKMISQIREISQKGLDVQFSLIEYRDHPPQDTTFTTKTHAFTDDQTKMQREVERMSASGGGDRPEAMYDGVVAAVRGLSWRPYSDRQIFLIADSPPHSPCLCGLKSYEVIKELQGGNIVLNAFSIEAAPDTGNYMRELTNATNGLFEEGTARESFGYVEHIYTNTALAMDDAHTYNAVFTACASAGTSTSDISIAKESGMPLERVIKAKTYLSRRGMLKEGK